MLEKILESRQVPLPVLLAAAIVVGLVAGFILVVPHESAQAEEVAFVAQGEVVFINKSDQLGKIRRTETDDEYPFRIPEECVSICPELYDITTFEPIEAPARRATRGTRVTGCDPTVPPGC